VGATDAGPPKESSRRDTLSGPRGGFTLIELLVVLAIIGIVSGIAYPRLRAALLKARAVHVVGQIEVVEQAVVGFVSDKHVWPPDAQAGQTPTGLEPYLPDGFSFAGPGWTLNYDNWSDTPVPHIGVSVHTPDREFGRYLIDAFGARGWSNGTNKYTVVIEWL